MLTKRASNSITIHTYPQYLIMVARSGVSTYNINRVLKLQKRAARIILHADFMTPSRQMFQELRWLSFPKRIQYHTCVMVFKSLSGLAPEYLTNLLTKPSDTNGRILRSNQNEMLKIPFSKTKCYDKSFSVTGPRLWNSLHLELRQSSRLKSFKKTLKSYLLDNEL